MSAIKNILIAEDELLVAKVLKLFLEKKNYVVKHVSDERSAVIKAKEFMPDLIIMDVYLKDKTSGINASKQIRLNGSKSPIIFTTGNSIDQTTDAIKEILNSYLFIKPVDIDQLIRFIEEKL